MSRLTTNYTITYASNNLTITYSSTYAAVSFSSLSYTFQQLGSTNYFVIGEPNALTTLDYTKCTSPASASVSALQTNVAALIITAFTTAGNIIPAADDTYSLGSSSKRWTSLFCISLDNTDTIRANNGFMSRNDGTGYTTTASYQALQLIARDLQGFCELFMGSMFVTDYTDSYATIQAIDRSWNAGTARPLVLNPTLASVQVGPIDTALTSGFVINDTTDWTTGTNTGALICKGGAVIQKVLLADGGIRFSPLSSQSLLQAFVEDSQSCNTGGALSTTITVSAVLLGTYFLFFHLSGINTTTATAASALTIDISPLKSSLRPLLGTTANVNVVTIASAEAIGTVRYTSSNTLTIYAGVIGTTFGNGDPIGVRTGSFVMGNV
jgi:hypothetical protein